MHRSLWGVGASLMTASLLVTLFISMVDPLWAVQHLTLLAACEWAQQAALLLGAALVAAGSVVARLAPPEVVRRDARTDAPSDWFS